MTQTIRLDYADLFRHEIKQARNLGFQVGVRFNDTSTAASVRLTPLNDKARHAIRQASNGTAIAIEATAPCEQGSATAATFAVRDALRSVLDRAQDACA